MVTLDRLVNVLGGYGVRLCTAEIPRAACAAAWCCTNRRPNCPNGRPGDR